MQIAQNAVCFGSEMVRLGEMKSRILLVVFGLVCLTPSFSDAAHWPISISPENGHIRVNKTAVIMCQAPATLDECKFKIDDRTTLDFSEGTSSRPIVATEGGLPVFTARYVGEGLREGHCGLHLSNVASGFYVIGCQLRDWKRSTRQEFMTLMVDDARPLKLKVNLKYQHVEPGSDVTVLCSSVKKRKLDQCSIRLPSSRWVQFNQGHRSGETSSYHYHGRGLEKGDCGVSLLNVTEGDSGLILCQAQAGAARGLRGVFIKVANLTPSTEILWDESRSAIRGGLLKAECVMKGAYPLPQMVWHYEGKEVKRSDVDDTPRNASAFRWPWEDHVMKQNFERHVGHRLGRRRLLCSAAETYLDGDRFNCPGHPDDKETYYRVEPECGLRTMTHYDTTFGRKVTKRETRYTKLQRHSFRAQLQHSFRLAENGELVEVHDVKFVSEHVDDAAPKPLDKINTETQTSVPASEEDSDISEENWDEATEVISANGSVALGPITYKKFDYDAPSCGGGAYGATSVLPYGNDSATLLSGVDPIVVFASFPWTTGVYKKKKNTGEYEQQCGGTLVTETHVISAAHCFWSEQTSQLFPVEYYMVALGKVFRDWDRVDDMVQKRGVRQLHVHPSYRGRKRNYQYDIAVIEMTEKVVYSPRVAPACLDWEDNEIYLAGKSGVVTGWGFTEEELPSEVLRYVELPYIDVNTCHDNLPENLQTLLTTDKFCAGFSNRNTSVCPGDSGGGILFQEDEYGAHFLKGVVSIAFRTPEFVGKCYHAGASGFTMISQSIVWLKGILNFSGSPF